jgi:tetratricopeptide (TPR) repeat protein
MKALIFLFSVFLTASFAIPTKGQKASVMKSGSAEAINERQRAGLLGDVRRVRVESAKFVIKDGRLKEGPRVVREITTYDIKGKRIDNVVHNVDSNKPPGKAQYRYDDKGNIAEKILRADDGSMLSKEVYQYEFDELGNWKKMTTSIAVYENEKVSFEPTEVSYRTIAYFYNQSVAKIAEPPNSEATVKTVKNTPSPRLASPSPPIAEPTAGSPPKTIDSQRVGNTFTNAATTKPETPGAPVEVPAKTKKDLAHEAPTVIPRKVAVRHVPENVLRAAAIELPQPEFPSMVQLSGQRLKVEIQVVVNEKGEVTSARSTAPESLLTGAAEAAARRARFYPAKLSEEPAQIFSVISYELAPAPAGAAAEDISSIYKQGVSFLKEGRYDEAIEQLNRFIYRNPEAVEGYSALGTAYSALHKYEQAVIVFKLAIKIRPDLVDASTYFELGLAYSSLKKYSEALNVFKQALYVARAQSIEADQTSKQASPGAAVLQYNIGLAHFNLGQYNDAIREIKQAIRLNPQLAESYFALALAYLHLGDRLSAEKQEVILRSLNPGLAKRVAEEIANRRLLFIPPGCLALPCQ